jgi:Protein of unknown function (DUF2817)
MNASSFSTDYASARSHFLKAASAVGARVDSYPYPARGPSGEELATDVAWIGHEAASKVLVTVSGTHGVEGFCGSGAQIDWLEREEHKRLPDDTAAVLIHALNPYGFAWRRRVTHENVDLNRNWVDYSQPVPLNAAYDELADAVCPAEWSDQSRAQTIATLQGYIREHGMQKFVQVVSGGQYKHDKGIFFGGTAPTASRLTLTSIVNERLSHAKHVAFIDYHSGLGIPGFAEQITSAGAGSPACDRARAWFGAAVTSIGTQGEEFAKVGGDWLSAVPQMMRGANVTAIALEFGTVGPLQVLDALRADNWLHAHGDPLSPNGRVIKDQITNAFYLDNDVWRGMVLGQSLLACRQALAGLKTQE